MVVASLFAPHARADDAVWTTLRDTAAVLIVRHAQTEPGIGDPPGFRLHDCGTQRNLSPAGRAQATAMGRRLAERGIRVSRVESSRWCRCIDTARLAFPGLEVHTLIAQLVFRRAQRGAGADECAALTYRSMARTRRADPRDPSGQHCRADRSSSCDGRAALLPTAWPTVAGALQF
jgi:hypothetical protein